MSDDDDDYGRGGPPIPPDEESRELDEQIAGYLKWGLPAATLICATVGGVFQGAPAVVLALAAGALVAVIAIFWASIRTLVGETALSGADAYALGAPRAEEEQKRAVLRALKDLEFERSVGKISEEDYQELVAKYRAEGKRLIRVLDEEAQPRRQKVEALVVERLLREGLGEEDDKKEVPPEAKPEKQVKAKAREPKPEKDDGRPACASCGTKNDVDAVFCKKCGARQAGVDDEDDESDEEATKPEQEEAP
jgi:hypothetical protein